MVLLLHSVARATGSFRYSTTSTPPSQYQEVYQLPASISQFTHIMAAFRFTRKVHPCRTRIVCKPLSHRRTFHVTSPTRIWNESFAITHSFITGLHTFTGLPWAATLPLAGFVVRSFMIAPLSYYSEIIGRRRMALQPLQYAWLHFIRRRTLEDHASLGPAKCNRLSIKLFSAKKAELNKRHGTQLWKSFVPYF